MKIVIELTVGNTDEPDLWRVGCNVKCVCRDGVLMVAGKLVDAFPRELFGEWRVEVINFRHVVRTISSDQAVMENAEYLFPL